MLLLPIILGNITNIGKIVPDWYVVSANPKRHHFGMDAEIHRPRMTNMIYISNRTYAIA